MTRQHFTPREYQRLMLDWILNHPRCAVWAGMGLGKTVTALTALDMLSLLEPGPALVLAPLRVAASTWPDEIMKWEHLRHLRVSAVVGSVAQRQAALQRDADIYTTNYDNLPWLLTHCGQNWPFRKIVADEATRLKSFRLQQGGKRAQALSKITHTHVDRFLALTGTPAPNGLQDLWGPMWFLDRGARLGRSFNAFRSRWFRSVRVGEDAFATRLDPLPFAQAQIEERLQDICLSIAAEDWFDLREPVVNIIRVPLPAHARKLYLDMEKKMFVEIACGTAIEAFSAASKTIKCLQLASGAIYTDETSRAFAETHDAKLQALDSIIEEAGGAPVLVAYHFKSDLARLQRAFPRGRVLDKNPQTIRDWNAGRIPALFAHPASAGHGLNLQDGGNILVFFSHWWALEDWQQIIERIGPTRQAQAGHARQVFLHYIVAADTLDEVVMARRETKREVQDLLLDAMKRREGTLSAETVSCASNGQRTVEKRQARPDVRHADRTPQTGLEIG